MTNDELIAGIELLIAQYRLGQIPAAPLPDVPEVPQFLVVTPDQNLQQALDNATGPVHLVEGASYPGVTLPTGAVLVGNGAEIVGVNVPALYVAPGSHSIAVSDVVCTSNVAAVVQLGDNLATTQSTLEAVPHHIKLERVTVPTHRGKRAFEVNASDVELLGCQALDIYDPAQRDSQAILILNTPGRVTVIGGEFVAGSENILIGGDTIKIPGVIQSDLLFDSVKLHKPESWRTDGINRAVKNLFEVKAGRRVTLKNSTLSGSWKAGQDGWAIVITPKNSQLIEDVLIDNVVVDRASGGVLFLGKDYNSVTPAATRGVVVRDSAFVLSKSYGGRGILALYVAGMLDSTWERVTATFDGTAIVVCDTQVPAGPFTMTDSTMPTGSIAVAAPGVNYGGPTPLAYAGREFTTVFERNTFLLAPSAFKKFYPNNTFV
jgi:hypothetical protein